jgi:hypothetical protein
MEQDLAALAPEDFFRLAVERGGLDLYEVVEGLEPEVADTLWLVAGQVPQESQTRGERGLEVTRRGPDTLSTRAVGMKAIQAPNECPACGHQGQQNDRFCRNCGRELLETARPVTVESMVAAGRLSAEQAEKVRSTLRFYQSNYTAGTRYSVYGYRDC